MRISSAAVSTLVLVLIVVALTGCASTSRGPTKVAAVAATPAARATVLASSPAASGLAHTDLALRVGVEFEQAHCAWNWHETRAAYLAALQALATTSYARQLATGSDPVSWRDTVVAQRQTVTCTISDAVRDTDAPATATAVYVRMSVDTEITSTLGTFTGGEQITSWLVVRTVAGWRVAGSFEGG